MAAPVDPAAVRRHHRNPARLAGLVCAVPVLASSPTTVRFNRDVRPDLVAELLLLPRPGRETSRGRLAARFAKRAATADLGDHAAIVPGKPDDSELLKRVMSHDDDEMMPPPK